MSGRGEKEAVLERSVKERKLVALMMGDLGISGTEESDVVRMNDEVGGLSDGELDRMLAERLELEGSVTDERLEEALVHVAEPEISSSEGPGGFTGAPDMSHEARPEERA